MPKNEAQRLRELILLSNYISDIKDLDVLMERILSSAREFVNCDAGSIYIKHDDHLLFSYTQNDTLSKRLHPGQKLIYTTFKVPIDRNSIAGFVASEGESLNIEDCRNQYESDQSGCDHHDCAQNPIGALSVHVTR